MRIENRVQMNPIVCVFAKMDANPPQYGTKVRWNCNLNAMFMRLETNKKLLFSSYVVIYYWWRCAALPSITPHGIFPSSSSPSSSSFFLTPFCNTGLDMRSKNSPPLISACYNVKVNMLMPTAYVRNLDAYIFTQNIAFYVNASPNVHEINVMQSKRGFFGISFT